MADRDNDAGAGNRTAFQAWFVPECDAREAALAALPGKEHHERFEALNRASQIFGKNGLDLQDHLAKFIGTDQFRHRAGVVTRRRRRRRRRGHGRWSHAIRRRWPHPKRDGRPLVLRPKRCQGNYCLRERSSAFRRPTWTERGREVPVSAPWTTIGLTRNGCRRGRRTTRTRFLRSDVLR